MENLQIIRKNRLAFMKAGVITGLCGICWLAGFGLAWAAVESGSGPKESAVGEEASLDSKQVLAELLKQPFTYQRENRPDPFATFIKKEVAKAKVTGVEPEEEILTGMQLFEPGQLSLVSIVFAGDRALAMVQDSVGKGYLIEKGTKIGRRGVVEDIVPNVVVIKQWSKTFAGQTKYNNIEMVLRKEGE